MGQGHHLSSNFKYLLILDFFVNFEKTSIPPPPPPCNAFSAAKECLAFIYIV